MLTVGIFQVPPIKWPDGRSDNDEYNKYWIDRFWDEGLGLELISFSLDIHPDEVRRLLRSMEISFKDWRCVTCGCWTHARSGCTYRN